ncbi:carboxypeptidase-like regulatory domain-containing protein, partial [Bacteroides uniformis]|uniref:carboxypeptidase-like regulatory domain-containing protein n=1 Tax=Bacteroides uniformis TaxID=820 RepID=UPI001D08AE21
MVYSLLSIYYTHCSSAKTLVISYIGMQTQEVAIKPSLKVVMKSDTEMLDEVMVVA